MVPWNVGNFCKHQILLNIFCLTLDTAELTPKLASFFQLLLVTPNTAAFSTFVSRSNLETFIFKNGLCLTQTYQEHKKMSKFIRVDGKLYMREKGLRVMGEKLNKLFRLESAKRGGITYMMTDPKNTKSEDIQALCDSLKIDGLSWKAFGTLVFCFRDPFLCRIDDDYEDDDEDYEDDDE